MNLHTHYNDWFINKLIQVATLHCQASNIRTPLVPDMFEDHFKTHLFFITMTLRPAYSIYDRNNTNEINYKLLDKEFNNYYKQVCRNVIPAGWKRKKAEQPFTIYALDAEGSKGGSVDWSHGQNVHVHGLMLFHPNTLENWKRLNPNSIIPHSSRIDDVLAVAYDPKKGTARNLVGYCTKAIRPASDQDCFYNFLPADKNGTRLERGLRNRANTFMQVQSQSNPMANGAAAF